MLPLLSVRKFLAITRAGTPGAVDVVGPYRLDALVGRGTTGAVWRATRQGGVAQEVAIKRARMAAGADVADRLRREAAILAELDHPHIVRVLDVLDAGADVAIVMSLARGGSLHDLLEERGRLTAGQTVAVLAPVAAALGSAHRRGVLHGDVKPANILFTSDGEPLLGDFGVAQHLLPGLPGLLGLEGDHERSEVEGTAGYVDPDLVATGRAGPRGDVYGLGVVAYLCLAGHLPHGGADTRAILAAAEGGSHVPLTEVPGVPDALAAVVESAFARDPERRPASAEELARALRAAVPAEVVDLPGTAVASDALALEPAADEVAAVAEARGTRAFGPRPERPEEVVSRGHPLLSLLGVVALLAAAVGGGLWVRDRLDARQAPRDVGIAGGGPPAATECPDLEPIPVPDGSEELTGDLNGDGCPVQVVWNGQVMSFRLSADDVEPRTFDFRSRGDRSAGQLLLGDWDCDGRDTPALYRPARGEVSYFSGVPGQVGGEVTGDTDDTGVRDGRAVVDPDGPDGCDIVDVSPSA